jgi:hypothetical protein
MTDLVERCGCRERSSLAPMFAGPPLCPVSIDADKDGVIDAARFLFARVLPVVLLGGSFGYARLTDRGEGLIDAIRSLDSPVVVAPEEEPEASLEEPCTPALMPRLAHGSPSDRLADDHEPTSKPEPWEKTPRPGALMQTPPKQLGCRH